MYIKIIKLDSVDSTNDYARNLACLNAKEITVVRANAQQRGKGRRGKRWLSPSGSGIYASFILRPSGRISDIYYLPLIFSLSVARVLEGILSDDSGSLVLENAQNDSREDKASAVKIKIPNDVMLNDKKIAGVLIEAKMSAKQADFVIVGIGININSKLRELPPKATSLYLQTKKCYNVDVIFRSLIKEVLKVYKDFTKQESQKLLEEVLRYRKENSLKKIHDFFTKEKQNQEIVGII